MVAKLPLPTYVTSDTINQIIDNRVHHRDFFNSIKEDWLSQANIYTQNNGNPETITPLNISQYISQDRIDAERHNNSEDNNSEDNNSEDNNSEDNALLKLIERRKVSLQGLYKPSRETELHVYLENMRDKHGLLFCPACGEPGKPTTLDHYLPQSKYPELSIAFENLTPMCDKCQRLKDNNTLDSFGNRLFIHPYYDAIDTVLIELHISPPYHHPTSFLARIPDDIESPLRDVFERHISELEFIIRFEEFCISEYSDLLETISLNRVEPERESVERIIRIFLNKAQVKSPNRWEAIFYRGVLGNQELLLFLDSDDLFQ